MDKTAIKTLIAWLEHSSLEAIREHQAFVLRSMEDIRSPEGRADAKLALRLIDEELLSRLNPAQKEA